ncbi:polyribonucleotide nucleotidyltransferase [Candidatus Uhrbacteria bacterium]|nr:polyribonucleotide nucleotidyltransferase [Candidatus Uhrbacteria bacterium]MBD3284389.1 polyribonucleotide nucleotidyltransferase [Candidatus Uhrbacteria bacterium]
METQHEYSIDFAGRQLTIGVGLLAQQTNGSCTIRFGDTVALCAATMGTSDRQGIDFFPLQVDFEERMYAAGRIKGSRFIKREGRPTDEAILSGRLIDRAIRPLFDDTIRRDVQVVTTVFSHDQENDADVPGLIGSSCALMLSDIPWDGPIAAVRIGRVNGELIVMPTYKQIDEGDLDLVVAGSRDKTIMVEAGVNELPEDVVLEAMKLAQESLSPVIDLINHVAEQHGKAKWNPAKDLDEATLATRTHALTLKQKCQALVRELAPSVIWSKKLMTKADRKQAKVDLQAALIQRLEAEGVPAEDVALVGDWIKELLNGEVTRAIIEEQKRVDGRSLTDVRDLRSLVAVMPRTHGSGLFERGETQVLTTATLGAPGMEQTLDTMEYQIKKRYFHHYNFPGYSVGEAKPNRGPGRREIGHGALAERALMAVLPPREDFPYTIRTVSEVLGSNGSSSMASTCGSTLALMDAGVPIKAPVAGVAMGIALDEETQKFEILTDIQDLEDGKGGMDFKITGTRNGVTAVQMDTKTKGLPWEAVVKTLHQAKQGRSDILDNMLGIIPEPRAELSPYAPRIETMTINPDKIRDVIGPGGKMIQEIIAETGVEIDIEDDGTVFITSPEPDGMKKAKEWIHNLTREISVGEVFEGTVTRLMDFGAFVEVLPKQEGLVHISEMAPERVNKVTDVVNVGDKVTVKVYEIDSMGRINLSMKRARPDYQPNQDSSQSRPPRRNGPPHRDRDRGPRPPRGDRPSSPRRPL